MGPFVQSDVLCVFAPLRAVLKMWSLSEQQRDSVMVLFVCMGNICRSPAGEGVMQKMVEQRGLKNRFLIDSAGTTGYHVGAKADARMRAAAKRRGYALASRSRQVTRNDLETFDLVIAMDRENLQSLERLHDSPSATIALLSRFLDERWPVDVPDPYYGGDDGFEQVLDMIEEACPAMIDEYLESK